MLTMVEVRTAQGETMAFPLRDVSSGYIVEEIEGLDPVKATLVSSSFAHIDGARYQNASRDPRNILLKLGLEPDYGVTSVRELRSRLYGYFMPKSEVTLNFYEDNVLTAVIVGRVESLESPLFTDEPIVDISILCFDPDFRAPQSTIVSGSTVADSTKQNVIYNGTTETGFIFRLNVNRAISSLLLYNDPVSGDLTQLEFVASLVAGDVLEISTVQGSKGAWLTRGSSRSSILYGVSPTATWMSLWPGLNEFRAQVSGAAIPYTIEYTAKYGGL